MKKILFILCVISAVLIFFLYFFKDVVYFNSLNISLLGAFFSVIIALIVIEYYLKNKKEKEWSAVKKVVIENMKSEISGLFYDIVFLSDEPTITYWSEKEDKTETNKLYKQKLNSIASLDEIKISDLAKEGIRKGSWHNLFGIRLTNLNWIELKYSKYFNPTVVVSLIIIQRALTRIDINLKMFDKRKIEESILFNDFQILFAEIIKEIKNIDVMMNLFS